MAPILAEFILEDEKLVTDGISSDRIPSNLNLRTGNRLKVAKNSICSSTKLERKGKGSVEQRGIVYGDSMDIITGQTNSQFKRRSRVNCNTLNFILNAVEDLITKEVTKGLVIIYQEGGGGGWCNVKYACLIFADPPLL